MAISVRFVVRNLWRGGAGIAQGGALKFFKHFTDSNRGRSMQAVLSELGHTGHSVWWLLVEMCAEKLTKHVDEEYTEAHCTFVFNERFLRDNLRLSGAKVVSCLNQYQTLALLTFKITGPEIHVHMPKLLESLDRDTKRARHLRVTPAPKRKSKKKREIKNESAAKAGIHPLATLWNLSVKNLAKVKRTENKRRELCENVYEDYTEDAWAAIFMRADGSSFLCGSKGWVASFDWVLKNANRIDEGEFDNKTAAGDYSAFSGLAEG